MIVAIKKRIPMINVLATQRPFTLLWVGQFISFIGDNIFKIALAWEVLLLTGSALAMGLVYLASLIPTIVFALVGGVFADRLPRRLILLLSDGGRAVVVMLVAALSLLHLLLFWHLVVLSLIFGIVESFFQPAYQAIQPQLVDRDLLQAANSLNSLGFMLSRIIGPPLGALCVVAAGGPSSAFALDSLSFFVSVSCLLALRLPAPATPFHDNAQPPGEAKGIRGVLTEVGEGVRYVIASTWLWTIIVIAACTNVTYSVPLAVALPKLVRNVYGAGPWLLGMLIAADAAGAIVATLVVGQLGHLRRRGIVAYSALLISCLSLTVLGLPLSRAIEPAIAMVASAFAGFGMGTFGIMEMTLLQELVPENKLGRVFSIDMLGSYLLIPLGLLSVGFVTDRVGPSLVFIAGGILSLGLVIGGLCVRDIRELA